MMKMMHLLVPGLCAALLWVTGPAAAAGETATGAFTPAGLPDGWICQRCGPGPAWTIDLGLAPAYEADDAFRFGDYTGLGEKGAYLLADMRADYIDDRARYLHLDGVTLNPQASGFFAKGGQQGLYELRGSWQSIPRRFYDAALTPFSGSASELTLPDAWVRAPVTGGMSALAGSLEPVLVERDLDVLKLGATIRPGSRWKLDADYRRQTKKGRDLSSGSVLFSATEFASPVDYTSDDLEVALSYAGQGWQTSVRYLGSFFDNGLIRSDRELLTWDNPFTGVPGTEVAGQALAPDNEMHQLSLAGALRLPKRTVVSGQLAFGRLSQDEDLAPYTLNPDIAAAPLPTMSADAEAATFNLNLRAVTSPWRRLTLEGEVRFNDFDNRTPVHAYDYVVTDAVPAGVAATGSAYDYQRSEIKLRGEYRAGRRSKLQLGFDGRRFERSAQARSRTNTDRLWFRVHHRLGSGADVDLDLFTEQRNGSVYEAVPRPVREENPLMRKYNLSDRERYGIRLKGGIYPDERWDLGWEFEYGEDDYTETDIGLTATRYARAGLDVSWLTGNASELLGGMLQGSLGAGGGARQGALYASLFTEAVEVLQANSQRFSTPDWSAATADRFTSAIIGFDHPAFVGPVGLNLEYSWSLGRAETDNDTSGLKTDFPDSTSRRQRFDFGLSWPFRDSWSLGLHYLFEKVRSDDWSLEGVEPATVPNLLAMGAEPFNYDVNVVYLSLRYLRAER